jgi:hypothetical protein
MALMNLCEDQKWRYGREEATFPVEWIQTSGYVKSAFRRWRATMEALAHISYARSTSGNLELLVYSGPQAT